ncbi:MAG: HD domain-containing protein [Sedimentisphaerales bacterium]|nr:HD domain-containing protein [Sedimentisphaerales bacterium]
MDRLKRWFDEFTNRFLGDDEYVNANLHMKREHTRRTCQESLFLASELALDDSQRRIAELVALFHDVGRFPQFAQYRTYNDPRSVDHCRLGVEVLRQEGVLDVLSSQERQWVEAAVEHHGRKSLPADLKGQTLLHAKIIRDADKLDIFRVVVEAYRRYRDEPEGFLLEIELPDVPEHTPEVLEAVLHGWLIDYTKLRTLTDMKLCQLDWVYDLNFAASLKRIAERGYLEALYGFLPDNDAMYEVRRTIQAYVDSKLQRGA